MKIADRSSSEPHFVLLRHEMPAGAAVDSHWDLMLEQTGYLYTLRLNRLPVLDITVEDIAPLASDEHSQRSAAGCSLVVKRLPDHRKKYLDYEGPISGDRGEVFRVLRGTFRRASNGDQACTHASTIPAQVDLSKGARIELLASKVQLAVLDIPVSKANQQIRVDVVRWNLPAG